MSEWIKVENRGNAASAADELELAYWDGVCMCRTYGAWDKEAQAWYVGGEPIEEYGFIVTHYKMPYPLPEPPGDSNDPSRT
jgi:hypothetical protein